MLTRFIVLGLLLLLPVQGAYTACSEINSMIRWSELRDDKRYCDRSTWFHHYPIEIMQDNAGNFHVHGHIYELHYPYWSFYGFLGWGYGVNGDPKQDFYCTDAFGVTYLCSTSYYQATTTYPYLE